MKVRFITIDIMGRRIAEWSRSMLNSQRDAVLNIQVRELIEAVPEIAKEYNMNEGEIKIKVCYEV